MANGFQRGFNVLFKTSLLKTRTLEPSSRPRLISRYGSDYNRNNVYTVKLKSFHHSTYFSKEIFLVKLVSMNNKFNVHFTFFYFLCRKVYFSSRFPVTCVQAYVRTTTSSGFTSRDWQHTRSRELLHELYTGYDNVGQAEFGFSDKVVFT